MLVLSSVWPLIPRMYDIRDIDYHVGDKVRSAHDLRNGISIIAIDDQGFAPEKNLKNEGFQIHAEQFPQSMDLVRNYHVIICDLKGVFDQMDKLNGAYAIRFFREITQKNS